jgi:uncharacterized protein YeaO (DUF488 family)
MSQSNPKLGRVYGDQSENTGMRVLVDRVWPRGVSKDNADLYLWLKEVAPSSDLRKWYGHDEDKFAEFTKRYKEELRSGDQKDAYEQLKELVRKHRVTLLTGSKAVKISEAAVLQTMLSHVKSQSD